MKRILSKFVGYGKHAYHKISQHEKLGFDFFFHTFFLVTVAG